MFVRTTSLIYRSLRNDTKFYSKKNISNLLPRSKSKMNNNNNTSLAQCHEVNEPLLHYSSNNSSNVSLNIRQYTCAAKNEEMKRWSWTWWREWTIIFIVFGITGSTT